MGFCKIICKLLLIVINIIFLLLGLAFFIPGVMFKAESPVIREQIDPFLKSLNDMIKSSNYVGSGESINFEEIFSGVATGLIVFGLLLIILTVAVMIGCCCLNAFLIIYSIFVCILILVQAIMLGMFFTGKFDDKMQTKLQDTILEKYKGTDQFDVDSVVINLLNLKWECCGVNGYEDFATAKVWKRKREKQVTHSGVTVNVSVVLTTPISCCKMSGSFPSADPIDPEVCALTDADIILQNKKIEAVSNRKTGCWKKLEEEIASNKGLIVGACCGLIGFQVLLVVLAIIAYITTRNEKNSKVNYA